MIELSIESLAIIFAITFCAEIYGGIFGGGGYLIMPALIAMGVPPHLAIANNSAAVSMTHLTGAYVFHKHDFLQWRLLKWWVPGLILGPFLGVYILDIVPADVMKNAVLGVSLFGAGILLFQTFAPKRRDYVLPQDKQTGFALVCGVFIGFYKAFIAAGVGSLTALMLMAMGCNIKQAIGTKKPILLISGIMASVGYYTKGWLYLEFLAVMMVACYLAGLVSAHIAVRMNERLLRVLFLIAVIGLTGYALMVA